MAVVQMLGEVLSDVAEQRGRHQRKCPQRSTLRVVGTQGNVLDTQRRVTWQSGGRKGCCVV